MRAEDSAIGVGFVNDDEFQVAEKVTPVGVMRQNARVEHVGIAQDDAGVFANGGAVRIGGCRHRKWQVSGYRLSGFRFAEMSDRLILCKGFGWEKIKCAGFGVLKHGRKDRQVVGESLSAGCACGEDDIFMRAGVSPCGELMGVERRNAAGG